MVPIALSIPSLPPPCAVAIAIACVAATNGFANPMPSSPERARLDFDNDFMIGPVPGLTTGWHIAPAETAIFADITVKFWARADLAASVLWSGATEVQRDENGSTAECRLSSLDRVAINCEVRQGDEFVEHRSILDVSDVPIDQIAVTPIVARVFPFDVRDYTEEELEDLPKSCSRGRQPRRTGPARSPGCMKSLLTVM